MVCDTSTWCSSMLDMLDMSMTCPRECFRILFRQIRLFGYLTLTDSRLVLMFMWWNSSQSSLLHSSHLLHVELTPSPAGCLRWLRWCYMTVWQLWWNRLWLFLSFDGFFAPVLVVERFGIRSIRWSVWRPVALVTRTDTACLDLGSTFWQHQYLAVATGTHWLATNSGWVVYESDHNWKLWR